MGTYFIPASPEGLFYLVYITSIPIHNYYIKYSNKHQLEITHFKIDISPLFIYNKDKARTGRKGPCHEPETDFYSQNLSKKNHPVQYADYHSHCYCGQLLQLYFL